MIINIDFTTARGYKYETMRTEFDRNYRDEEQALIFMESEEDDFDGYFEVNIRKDKQGKAISEGYVCEYASTEDSDPQAIYEDAKIEVKLHDFDDVVELANAELMQDGLQIVLEYDGEFYWAIGTEIKATKEIKWFAENDFEDEVRGHIYECWAHARALADSLKEGKSDEKPAMKVWVVAEHFCKNWGDDLSMVLGVRYTYEGAKALADERFHQVVTENPDWEVEEDGWMAESPQGFSHGHISIEIEDCEVK